MEERSRSEDLERDGDEVADEEQAEFDATDGGLSSTGGPDQVGHKYEANAARDDVGDVRYRLGCADVGDAALGIHTNRSCRCVGR